MKIKMYMEINSDMFDIEGNLNESNGCGIVAQNKVPTFGSYFRETDGLFKRCYVFTVNIPDVKSKVIDLGEISVKEKVQG